MLDLAAFSNAGKFKPAVASENIPVQVHMYDVSSQDPADHAIIGVRLDDPTKTEPIRFSLAPDRRENAERERPGIYFFATDPLAVVNGDATKLANLLNKTPAHKCHTPAGGTLLLEGARPVDGKTNTYTVRWITRLSNGPADPDHLVRVGWTSVLPMYDGPKPFQAVRWFHPEDAVLVATSEELKASLSAILDVDYRTGNPGVLIRLHQPDGVTGEIKVEAADVVEFRRKKEGETYVDLTPAEALSAFATSTLGKYLLGHDSYGVNRIEIIPVSTVAFGPEVIKKVKAIKRNLAWPYMAERDDDSSIGIAMSTLGLYNIPNSDGAVIATLCKPVKRQIFSASDLPTPHHRPLKAPPIDTTSIDDDLPM